MNILIDMNLSPAWVQEFEIHHIVAVYWSTVGRFDAPDTELMTWARNNDYTIFTQILISGQL